MPDQFIKFPRVESIQYFESAMYGHNKVLRCKKISDSYYEIQREDLPPIFVFVSNYYRMFERKIQFSEEMINSKDIMEKKSALDFIIDALQYLISTKGDTRNEQYKALALSVSDNMDGKVYAVVKKELDELMKLSNEYFDVRHNDYLNAAKEKREPLNDSQFIEYLYNRAYSILYLLRLKS